MAEVKQAGNEVNCREWIAINAWMFKKLAPGTYPLHPKVHITPPVEGTQLCSEEDQRMIFQIDNVERDLLHNALQSKIRELNERTGKIMILLTNGNSIFPDVRTPQLHIIQNKCVGRDVTSIRNNLGKLLTMAYDQISVPLTFEWKSRHLPSRVPIQKRA